LKFILLNKVNIPQQDNDEDDDENPQNTTRTRRKEVSLPITSRVSGATKSELDRLTEQEVLNKILVLFNR
jgi:hypothetical protein